jgi:hypothetical protein
MESYLYLLGRIPDKNYQIHLYNGNWDYVVPFTDTINNIKRLNLEESYVQYDLPHLEFPGSLIISTLASPKYTRV